jgi:hypothetical protein
MRIASGSSKPGSARRRREPDGTALRLRPIPARSRIPRWRRPEMPADILLVDVGALLLVIGVAWYFRLFRRP